MTSARPMAMSRSRVQTRISFLREWTAEGAGAVVSGTDAARGGFWSVLCIFVLPSIYNTGVANRARLELGAALADRWILICERRRVRFGGGVRALPAVLRRGDGVCLISLWRAQN
jgi:hypothetical protein